MATTSSKGKDTLPLPLADTLRDLALLRASEVDLARLLPPAENEEDHAVRRSYEFVQEARAALRVRSRGEVDEQGERVERVRAGLEEVVAGLAPGSG